MGKIKTRNTFDAGNSISDTIDAAATTIYSDDIEPFDFNDNKNEMTAAFEAAGGSGTVVVTWEYFHGAKFTNNNGYGPGHPVCTITIDAAEIKEVDLYNDPATRAWYGRKSQEGRGRFKFVRSNSTGITTVKTAVHIG